MRIRNAALALGLGPLFLLAAGCSDQRVVEPQDASFNHSPGHKGGGGSDGGAAYEVVTLGTLGGSGSNAQAINNAPVVVGEARNAAGQSRAFVWTESEGMRDLFGSAHEPWNHARHINERGEVVGLSTGSVGFVYDLRTGHVVWLSALPQHTTSQAIAINVNGLVVGRSGGTLESGQADWRTVVWVPAADGSYGEPLDLACPVMQINSAINRAGDFVASECRGPFSRPHLYRSADGFQNPVTLGTLGGRTRATGIDDDGKIAGWSTLPSGEVRAVVWHPADYGAPIDLGAAVSVQGMNNQNRIVGARPVRKGRYVAAIWTVDDAGGLVAVQELPIPRGYSDSSAYGINDDNWVVGALTANSGNTATLWRPQP
jgi:probable HAF family extracellular repeat protein